MGTDVVEATNEAGGVRLPSLSLSLSALSCCSYMAGVTPLDISWIKSLCTSLHSVSSFSVTVPAASSFSISSLFLTSLFCAVPSVRADDEVESAVLIFALPRVHL